MIMVSPVIILLFLNNMLTLALGLIETRGLIGAIEAADAMVKTSNVKLIGKDRTDPAMITIKIIGETAAVRSAVEAGAAAAQKTGQLISKHVIPRPAEGLEKIIFDKSFLTQEEIDELLGNEPSASPAADAPGNSEEIDTPPNLPRFNPNPSLRKNSTFRLAVRKKNTLSN
jgi:ethanolamine utilization protein EutM